MRFSIIIPVYKVQNYLFQCIESVLCQGFTDYELILVDDGSPDLCPQICDQFQVRYPSRIRVIHKPNGGLSSARNAGLDVANGEYVIFIDSDDYWNTSTALSVFNERINLYSEDLVLYRFIKQKTNGEFVSYKKPYNLDIIDKQDKLSTISHLCNTGNIPGSAWIFCVRRALIESIGLRFCEGIIAEDYDWVMHLLYHAESIGAVNVSPYVYVMRPGSITTTTRPEGVRGISYAINRWLQLANRPLCLDRYLSKVYLIGLMNYARLSIFDRLALRDVVDADSRIFKESKLSAFSFIYSLCGPFAIGKAMAIIYRVRSFCQKLLSYDNN